jgi:hypothetical protein
MERRSAPEDEEPNSAAGGGGRMDPSGHHNGSTGFISDKENLLVTGLPSGTLPAVSPSKLVRMDTGARPIIRSEQKGNLKRLCHSPQLNYR